MLKHLIVLPAALAVAMAAPAFAAEGSAGACPYCATNPAKHAECTDDACTTDAKVADAHPGEKAAEGAVTYGLTGVKDKAAASAVEKLLGAVKGVHDAHVSADLKTVDVHPEPGQTVALPELAKALGNKAKLAELPAKPHADHHDHGDHHHDGPAHEGGDTHHGAEAGDHHH